MKLLRIAWDMNDRLKGEKIAAAVHSSLLELKAEWQLAFKEELPRLMILIADATWPVSERVSIEDRVCFGGLLKIAG